MLTYIKENLSIHQYRQDVHSYNTRNNKLIDMPHHRLAKSQNSFEVLGIKLYNTLPANLTQLPYNRFKDRLYNRLLANPYYSIQEYFENNT